MEQIKGTILKILFKNDQGTYAVCRIKIDYEDEINKKYKDYLFTNLLTVTCYYEMLPLVDEVYTFIGEFVESKYGLQFKASEYIKPNTLSRSYIVTYLSSDYFPGVGKRIASKIYDVLGNDCLQIIKKDKSKLDEIKDISVEIKDVIYFNLIENEKKEKTILSFVKMGFSISMASKIQSQLKPKDIPMCLENPYLLIDKIEGIGFLKADRIYLDMGKPLDDEIRLKACVVYILTTYTYETGNCYIKYDFLKEKALAVLNEFDNIITSDVFDEIINSLTIDGRIVVVCDLVYDRYIYEAETQVASNIISRINDYNSSQYSIEKIEKALKKVVKKNKIEYTEKQIEAIKTALSENISIITGGPGTGKSTIVKGILDTFITLWGNDLVLEEVILLAPTGRAAKRLNEVCHHEAQTIHRFLGYDGNNFSYCEKNIRNARLLIVDEMSMVDILLVNHLFKAINWDCKIVLVGDSDQIPSVGPGEVLLDLINSNTIKTTHLLEIHRQASDSSIITLAHSINSSNIPLDIMEKKKDRTFVYLNDEDIIDNIVKVINQAVLKNMNILSDIQVLIPMYKGDLGIDNINKILQDNINPLIGDNMEVITNKSRFRINDKVIQLVNRYDDSIMNGDIGYVYSFSYSSNTITKMIVQFENNRVEYTKEEFDELKLAYAISIHKSQGSEFKTVIIPFSNKYYPMLKKRLYYTAITRAKKYLIMIGNIESLKIAATKESLLRNTTLEVLLKEKNTKYENKLSPYDFM